MQLLPQNQVLWYLNNTKLKPLRNNAKTEVLVIGGGMSGLSTAQAFAEKGYKVILIEKNYCGAGASGKSSGFITPDSELSFFELQRIFGTETGKRLWELIGTGVQRIGNNIEKHSIDCEYQIQDTLVVANTSRAFIDDVKIEYNNREKAGYPSILYDENSIQNVLSSSAYMGGISYGGTFGIHAYKYCLAMKQILQHLGVAVYEETPAIKISNHKVITPQASIQADYIIVCTDRFEPALSSFLWIRYIMFKLF